MKFHKTQNITKNVMYTRNRAVPKKRAKRSERRPNASGSKLGRSERRVSRGVSNPLVRAISRPPYNVSDLKVTGDFSL